MMKTKFICILPLISAFVPSNVLKRNYSYGKTQSSLDMGAILYGSQGSRSPLVNWGAFEVDFPLIMGDLSKNPHPFKQIPGKNLYRISVSQRDT
jgi:hypothetical protein